MNCRILTIIPILLFLNLLLKAQEVSLNMEMVSNLSYEENLNDIWGFVDPDDGHEYAIVGTVLATSVFDLGDPTNPVEVAYIPGESSLWRDMKSYGNFVYVTTDVGTDGLLIIDMSEAPNNITSTFWKPDLDANGVSGRLEKCHNIYLDENGYVYLSGCNLNGGGVLIFDVFTNPGNPIFIGPAESNYSHDVMVQNNLLYSSNINDGFFSIIDVTDKEEPILLANQNTPNFFTHNAWVSTDNNFLFTTDERPNAFVASYDISDNTDVKFLDRFQPLASAGIGVIPHNTHYHNGYLVTSWYTDGVRIIDGNKPDNLVEVAYYDTYPQNNTGFNGVWGVTPYLPSGLVIASDINTGLYVFNVDYQRASYLEGTVTDSDNGLLLDGVNVVISGAQLNNKNTNAAGVYKTGLANAGDYMVTFSKIGYNDLTMPISISSGDCQVLDVELVPLKSYTITGVIKARDNSEPIENGRVLVQSADSEFEIASDANGEFTLTNVLEGEYVMYSGAWGYENIIVDNTLSIGQNETFEILLDRAYMDDFIVDLGWTVENLAETGLWVREVPIGTNVNGGQLSNPAEDVEGDIGNKAYVTGNLEGGVGDADIDGGTVVLTSPMMDLTTFLNPRISYSLWFFNGGGNGTPNDNVIVRISNGDTSVDVEALNSGDSDGSWRPTFAFDVLDLLELTSTMQFSVLASDDNPGHLVEAGLDNFLVSEAPLSAIDLTENDLMNVAPNPFNEFAAIIFETETSGLISITNVLGQLVETIKVENASQVQLGANYSKGTYFVSLESNDKKYKALKIIKQ